MLVCLPDAKLLLQKVQIRLLLGLAIQEFPCPVYKAVFKSLIVHSMHVRASEPFDHSSLVDYLAQVI